MNADSHIYTQYYIRYSTMKVILQLPEKATLKDILETMAQAAEFSDIRLRGNDKTVYNKIREHNDIRFRAGKIERTADKVMLLIQAVLGGISLNSAEFKTSDSQPALEALGVFKHACRIARAIVDVAIVRRSGSQIKFALELVRSLVAKAWDDRPIVLRQISHIGEKSIKVSLDLCSLDLVLQLVKVLTASGITNLSLLRSQDTFRLEALLNRKPPFGRDILAELKTLPSYTISVAEDAVAPSGGSDPVMVTLTITAGLAAPLAPPKGAKKLRTNFLGFACILAVTSDLELIDFRRIPVKALQEPRSYTVSAELNKPSQTISVLISSENFAGLTVTTTYKPSLAANAYPTKNTRPQGLLEAELRDLENCEGLWNSDNDTEAGGQTEHYFKDPEIEDPVPQKNSRARTPAHSSVMRLPNGNFRCHHTCKDRTRCRHVCCREGRAKPPGPSKRPSSKVRETSPSTTRKLQRDKTMQDLENLNSNTKFGMTAKGRLKIDAAKQPRRSRDETWLGFTQLGNEEEEEEELPELYELVKSKEPGEPIRQTSTDEFYDDNPESPTDRKKLSEAPYAKNSRSPVRSLNQSQRSRELRDVAFTKPDPPNLKELEGDNLDPIFDFDEDTFDMQHNEGKDSQSTPKEIRPCSSDQQPEWTATPLSSRVIVPPSAPQADATSHSLNPTKGAPFKPPTSVTRRDPFHKPLLNDGQATTLTPVTSSFANQYDEFMDWVYNSGEVEIVGQD
ncbi:Sec63 [Tulasnella sp. 419]|nr:Sec63 [Tulasnella sp. 419]